MSPQGDSRTNPGTGDRGLTKCDQALSPCRDVEVSSVCLMSNTRPSGSPVILGNRQLWTVKFWITKIPQSPERSEFRASHNRVRTKARRPKHSHISHLLILQSPPLPSASLLSTHSNISLHRGHKDSKHIQCTPLLDNGQAFTCLVGTWREC